MKNKRKILLTLACAVLLVAASVMGTMAWLTDTETVTNSFTIGQITMSMDETDVTVLGEKDTDTRVTANTYHLMPGHSYIKDPTIHVVAKSENCYLFVTLDNPLKDLIDASTESGLKGTIEAQMIANGWVQGTGTGAGAEQNGLPTNVWFYKGDNTSSVLKPVEKSESVQDIKLFESFKIKDDASNTQITAMNGKQITVTAYAIQADGMDGLSVSDIWSKVSPVSGN